jgi:hypothetical protein
MNKHNEGQMNHEDMERNLRELAGLGRMWARHGLDLGARALQASARTLQVTGNALDGLSNELRDAPDAATGSSKS